MRTAGLGALTKRNVKLYFKDKGMFFSSLITPLILLVLYTTFLKNVFEDSFRGALDAAGAAVSDSIIGGCVGGQLVSSLLAVSCVTVAFCSNLLMVQDKISGARRDLTVTPVHSGTLALSYYAASLLSTLIISFAASAVCFAYLAAEGWYLSTADVAAVIGDVILLCLFGTALSSCVNFPLTTQGQASAVGTIVSAGYGFIGRTSKSSFLPPGDIRNQHAEKSCTARRIRRNVRPRISGSGARIHQGQCRLQHIFLRR